MTVLKNPPFLTGDNTKDLANLRDYLFRMAKSLDPVIEAQANVTGSNAVTNIARKASAGGGGNADEIEKIKQNAKELKSLIVKTAKEVNWEIGNLNESVETLDTGLANTNAAIEAKTAEYDQRYTAASEFGTFTASFSQNVEEILGGVLETYDYEGQIQSVANKLGDVPANENIWNYIERVNGEIQRGIVQDPSTGDYVTGIAISQNLQFGAECGPSDPNNPGDGNTYYYLTSGQTFGLYTSTGWQFWIDGAKVGWFDSQDGMLHVGTVHVEERIINGGYWEEKTENINGDYMFVINYIGS